MADEADVDLRVPTPWQTFLRWAGPPRDYVLTRWLILRLLGFVYVFAAGLPFLGTNGTLVTTLAWLYGTTLGAGYLVSIALGAYGLQRRGVLSSAWWLVWVPVHWMLLSLAAWRALYQLTFDVHGWEKTQHGLALTSRRARRSSRNLLHAIFASQEREPRREAAE